MLERAFSVAWIKTDSKQIPKSDEFLKIFKYLQTFMRDTFLRSTSPLSHDK